LLRLATGLFVLALSACDGTGSTDSGTDGSDAMAVADAPTICNVSQDCASTMRCSLIARCVVPRTTVVSCTLADLPADGEPCSDADSIAGAYCRPIGGCHTNCEREVDCGIDHLWHLPLGGSACRDPADSGAINDPSNAGPRCLP